MTLRRSSLLCVSLCKEKNQATCLLVHNTMIGVKDFSRVFHMPQADTSSSLKELKHFGGNHEDARIGGTADDKRLSTV